jgi:hypothetical protein
MDNKLKTILLFIFVGIPFIFLMFIINEDIKSERAHTPQELSKILSENNLTIVENKGFYSNNPLVVCQNEPGSKMRMHTATKLVVKTNSGDVKKVVICSSTYTDTYTINVVL